MRNSFLSIPLFIFYLFLAVSSSAQVESEINIRKDVLDYYWEMASSDSDLIHYPIELKDKKWLTVSNADYELEATVDYRKGYIFIKDPGKGEEDKASSFQFVMYERNKDNPLIAISKKKYLDEKWVTEVGFWEKRGGLWTNIVKEVLPELSYHSFLEGTFDRSAFGIDLPSLLPIYFDLPKKGNNIMVLFLSEGLKAHCMNGHQEDENCNVIQYIKYQSVELRWNKGKSNFSLGKFQK